MPSGRKSRRRAGKNNAENSGRKRSSKKVRRGENTGYEANTEEPYAGSQESSEPPELLTTILAQQGFTNAAKSLRNVTRSGRGDTRLQEVLQSTAEAHAATGKTELMYAAFKGDIPKIKSLIKSGGKVHAADSFGRTALVWAVEGDHAQVIHLLCQKGAAVNKITDYYLRTPLYIACLHGKRNAIKALCEEGANPSFIYIRAGGGPDSGIPCLAAASHSYDHPDSLRVLIKYGAAIDPHESEHTPLSMACAKGRINSVKLLLEAGAALNLELTTPRLSVMAFEKADNIENISPTYAADVYDIVGLLIERGANINARHITPGTTVNYSAITYAAERNINVCRALLHYGADPNLKVVLSHFVPGMIDMPPLKFVSDIETCRLLLNHGADPHSPASDTGITVLMWYINLQKSLDIIKELCLHLTPEQLNAKSSIYSTRLLSNSFVGGFNALHYACLERNAHPELIELLGSAGIDVNAKHFFEQDGVKREADTPLMMVCREKVLGTEMLVHSVIKCRDRLAKVEALLRIGANTEVQDANRMTPLMIACQGINWNTLPIVEALCSKPRVSNLVKRETARPTTLRRGIANLEVRNIKGRTAFMIAILNGTLEVAQYLVKRGADIHAVENSGKNALDISIEYKNEDGPGISVYLNEIRFLRELGLTSTVVLSQENEDLLQGHP